MEAGGGGGGGGGETILIRGVWAKDKGYNNYTHSSRCYSWSVFHKVDLKKHKLEEDCLPRLKTWTVSGQMVFAAPKLYVIGGESEDLEYEQRAFVLDTTITNDEEEEEETWEHLDLPIPTDFRPCHNCTSLDGKIYHYAYRSSKAFDYAEEAALKGKKGGFWEFIWSPPELDTCFAEDGRDFRGRDFREAGRLVADPPNNRILLCCQNGFLYAYYPQGGAMKLVREGLFIWSNAVAVAYDVAFVHLPKTDSGFPKALTDQLIHAFDVSDEGKGKPLEVRWTTTLVDQLIDGGLTVEIDLSNYEFDALFHLGNNNFCFAVWTPVEDDTIVYFIKFGAVVHRGSGVVTCTPLTLQKHLLPSTALVLDFALLH